MPFLPPNQQRQSTEGTSSTTPVTREKSKQCFFESLVIQNNTSDSKKNTAYHAAKMRYGK